VSRVYWESAKVLGVLLVVLGAAMVVSTLARGGGPFALGVVLGVLFIALGAARLKLAGALGTPNR
jgi:hypothetical protein